MWFYKWVIFEQKRRYGKEISDISELFIQCNTDNCCEDIAGVVNTHLYECVSTYLKLLANACSFKWLSYNLDQLDNQNSICYRRKCPNA